MKQLIIMKIRGKYGIVQGSNLEHDILIQNEVDNFIKNE